MIKSVYIKNFRGIGEQEVALGDITALVGKNGAGKSSFVDALRLVRDSMTLGLEDAVLLRHGIAALRRWSPTRPYDIEIRITGTTRGSLHWNYGFTLASGREGDFHVKHEIGKISGTLLKKKIECRFERKRSSWVEFPTSERRSMTNPRISDIALALPNIGFFTPDFFSVQRFFRSMGFYTIFPNTLREPQKPSPTSTLSDHGENLATILRKLKSLDRHKPIVQSLDQVVGGIKDINVQQVGGFLVTQIAHSIGGSQQAWFDLSQESDGTLRLLGILAALYQRSTSPFVVIEEPELTLHPGALGLLCDMLKGASSNRQMLITTQSPDLIARLGADDLRAVERSIDTGITTIKPIAEDQRAAIESALFSAGDLLRIEGLRS